MSGVMLCGRLGAPCRRLCVPQCTPRGRRPARKGPIWAKPNPVLQKIPPPPPPSPTAAHVCRVLPRRHQPRPLPLLRPRGHGAPQPAALDALRGLVGQGGALEGSHGGGVWGVASGGAGGALMMRRGRLVARLCRTRRRRKQSPRGCRQGEAAAPRRIPSRPAPTRDGGRLGAQASAVVLRGGEEGGRWGPGLWGPAGRGLRVPGAPFKGPTPARL